jgi:hypothetical protein
MATAPISFCLSNNASHIPIAITVKAKTDLQLRIISRAKQKGNTLPNRDHKIAHSKNGTAITSGWKSNKLALKINGDKR